MDIVETEVVKLLIDNGFAVLVAFLLLGALLWLVRSLGKYIEKREETFLQKSEDITHKYEQITQNAITTMANIANSFEDFVRSNKEEVARLFNLNNQIVSGINKIDKKIDKIITYDPVKRIRSTTKRETNTEANPV